MPQSGSKEANEEGELKGDEIEELDEVLLWSVTSTSVRL